MLEAIFKTVLGMTLAASFTALTVVPLKIILQKLSMSKKALMLLWLIIAFRLVCPYAPESRFSLFNMLEQRKGQTSITVQTHTLPTYDASTKNFETDDTYQNVHQNPPKSINAAQAASWMWILGILATSGYSAFKALQLKRRLKFSTKLESNIYESDAISTSFVFGFFKPKIYIPEKISEHDRNNMIIHEQTHIRYHHNRIKIISRIILAIHWFNPLVWIMFRMVSDDMEYICDESSLESVHKKSYINSILTASQLHTKEILSPDVCSFSSLSKKRIANLARYKKRSRLYSLPPIALCIACTLLFGTSGVKGKSNISEQVLYPLNAEVLSRGAESTDTFINTPIESVTAPLVEAAANADTPENINENKNEVPKDNPIPKSSLGKYKSDEESEMPYVGFELLEPDGISRDALIGELEKSNLTQTHQNADLSKNYITGDYAFSEEGTTIPSVTCDEKGNISLYISLNTESLFDVNVYDSETGDNVSGCIILANGKNAYSLIGFDTSKKYDINIKEKTNGQWKLHGSYVIY